jgi:hypothetical protein
METVLSQESVDDNNDLENIRDQVRASSKACGASCCVSVLMPPFCSDEAVSQQSSRSRRAKSIQIEGFTEIHERLSHRNRFHQGE